MVRTRSQSLFAERPNESDLFGEIRERARNRRPINPLRSPRKRSILKQKRKEKRVSMEFERRLSNQKQNLSKVWIIDFFLVFFLKLLLIAI